MRCNLKISKKVKLYFEKAFNLELIKLISLRVWARGRKYNKMIKKPEEIV